MRQCTIQAGGDLNASAGQIQNVAFEGIRTLVDSSTATSFWRHRKSLRVVVFFMVHLGCEFTHLTRCPEFLVQINAQKKLLDKFGSPDAALSEVQKSAQSIANGNYQTGSWVSVKVGDISVSIKGKVIDGVFRISSIAKEDFYLC